MRRRQCSVLRQTRWPGARDALLRLQGQHLPHVLRPAAPTTPLPGRHPGRSTRTRTVACVYIDTSIPDWTRKHCIDLRAKCVWECRRLHFLFHCGLYKYLSYLGNIIISGFRKRRRGFSLGLRRMHYNDRNDDNGDIWNTRAISRFRLYSICRHSGKLLVTKTRPTTIRAGGRAVLLAYTREWQWRNWT